MAPKFNRIAATLFSARRQQPPQQPLHPPRRFKWVPSLPPGMAAPSQQALDPAADRATAAAFIVERGYEPVLADAIVAALSKPEWGAAAAGGINALATRLAGRWEVGEDAGLHSLAKAVERELAATTGKAVVRFKVMPPRGEAFAVECIEGMTLTDVAQHGDGEGADTLGELIECACSGVMACSTCHVHIDAAWAVTVGEATEEEEDMLDLAYDRQETSRLGCQLVLTPELEGLVIKIPGGANNLFDHIPFEEAGRASERSASGGGVEGGGGASAGDSSTRAPSP